MSYKEFELEHERLSNKMRVIEDNINNNSELYFDKEYIKIYNQLTELINENKKLHMRYLTMCIEGRN